MLSISDSGERNLVKISPGMREALWGNIIISGNDNCLEIGDNSLGRGGLNITMMGDANVNLGGNLILASTFIFCTTATRVIIGSNSGFNGNLNLLLHEPASISIGEGCLFAGDISISVSDMHSIIDIATGQRINWAKDVVIGNRVWLGSQVTILKGVEIGDGSIIGQGSTVTKNVPSNCVAAGVPARVIKEGATWNYRLIPRGE